MGAQCCCRRIIHLMVEWYERELVLRQVIEGVLGHVYS